MVLPEELPLIPEIPNGVREAATRGVLIPFVGAGTSLLAGCPSWNDLAKRSLETFLEAGRFSFAQMEQLSHLSPRVKLSIALGLQAQTGTQINFRKLVSPSNTYDFPKGRRLYGLLSSLAKTFVTTNYDEWLDKDIQVARPTNLAAVEAPSASTIPPPRPVYYDVSDFTPANLNSPGVFHIHGSLLKPDGMIMTTRQYLQHYANDHHDAALGSENRLLTFLEYLFQRKTVLFVGYGLEELEILEYAIQKARSPLAVNTKETKHYILQGYFSHELELMRSMRDYYQTQCGIELIPFRRDERSWDQLVEVLEAFAGSLVASDAMLVQDLSDMEALL